MTEKVIYNATVCLPIKDNKVLLGFKTRNIGKGCWNGYGGGIEKGETPIQSAIRELEEETGLKTESKYLEKRAIINFHNLKSDGEIFICKVHFFVVKKWTGTPIETNEMKTHTFFDINNLPFIKMMLADKEYFPLILKGKKVIGEIKYGPYQKELLDKAIIKIVKKLPEN